MKKTAVTSGHREMGTFTRQGQEMQSKEQQITQQHKSCLKNAPFNID